MGQRPGPPGPGPAPSEAVTELSHSHRSDLAVPPRPSLRTVESERPLHPLNEVAQAARPAALWSRSGRMAETHGWGAGGGPPGLGPSGRPALDEEASSLGPSVAARARRRPPGNGLEVPESFLGSSPRPGKPGRQDRERGAGWAPRPHCPREGVLPTPGSYSPASQKPRTVRGPGVAMARADGGGGRWPSAVLALWLSEAAGHHSKCLICTTPLLPTFFFIPVKLKNIYCYISEIFGSRNSFNLQLSELSRGH